MHEVAAYTIVIPKAQDGDCMVYGGEAPRSFCRREAGMDNIASRQSSSYNGRIRKWAHVRTNEKTYVRGLKPKPDSLCL